MADSALKKGIKLARDTRRPLIKPVLPILPLRPKQKELARPPSLLAAQNSSSTTCPEPRSSDSQSQAGRISQEQDEPAQEVESAHISLKTRLHEDPHELSTAAGTVSHQNSVDREDARRASESVDSGKYKSFVGVF